MVYYEQQGPDDHDSPPGCLDAVAITRAVFGVLAIPIGLMVAVVFDVGLTFYLFATRPVLALIPIVVTVAAIWAFAKWEQRQHAPPEDL